MNDTLRYSLSAPYPLMSNGMMTIYLSEYVKISRLSIYGKVEILLTNYFSR